MRKIAKPLYDLTKPKIQWLWTDNCENDFASLKEKLTSAPILAYPDTDASSFAIGEYCRKFRTDKSEL